MPCRKRRFDRIWDAQVIKDYGDGRCLIQAQYTGPAIRALPIEVSMYEAATARWSKPGLSAAAVRLGQRSVSTEQLCDVRCKPREQLRHVPVAIRWPFASVGPAGRRHRDPKKANLHKGINCLAEGMRFELTIEVDPL
jgi:hypothetical protein